MSEGKMIRFIDSEYNDLFYLRDGENARLIHSDGGQVILPCKFVDECHTQVGNYIYHICEFAEMMERAGTSYLPEDPPALPDRCFAILPSSGEVIAIARGEKGYLKTGLSDGSLEKNRRLVAQYNRYNQVTRQQEAAMLGGSMFGWKTPAARTSSYDLRGNPIAPAREKPAKSKAPER